MKYHYQLVSPTAVRIELIPEDKNEIAMLGSFVQTKVADGSLDALFQKALAHYNPKAEMIRTRFMNFPKVALCSYQLIDIGKVA